ncbi:hypothetical protein [Rhodospirillaceae bacterium SYSU D60014]|jgi:hypothetical protein|uniref:hypothetical protein n=1 Tax=Virgifigura deserti TaxID=2268457 RepID=UPI0013C46AA7
MKAFLLGTCIALVLGVGTAILYDFVGIGTAEFYATEGVRLPETIEDMALSGE